MSSIQDAINQATEAAAQMTANQEAAASDVPAQGTEITGYANAAGAVQTFSKPTMASVKSTTGLIPRSAPYLKPTEFGFKIGKNKALVESFVAYIDLTEDKGFRLKHTVRYGNPAKYLSTYDGALCNKGGTWGEALRRAQMADPSAEPYYAAEIKLELAEELSLKDEKLEAGAIIGYDTSAPSRFNDWSDFYDAASMAGLVGQRVKVKVVCKEIEHNGNNWATVLFEVLDD